MHRPYLRYRRDLKGRAQLLRRNATVAEKRLWFEFLRDLPQKFTRQKPLGRYVADFYCSRARLVIEVDGDSHFSTTAEARDEVRTRALAELGLDVLRFTNVEVMENFEGVCESIRTRLRDRESG